MNRARRDIYTSEIWELVDQLTENVDHLRCRLDGFLSGNTRELRGIQTRGYLNLGIRNLKTVIQKFEKIRERQQPSLRGRVTATMVQRVNGARKCLESLRGQLYPILSVPHEHKITSEQHTYIFGLLDVLRETVRRLNEDVGNDDAHESAGGSAKQKATEV